MQNCHHIILLTYYSTYGLYELYNKHIVIVIVNNNNNSVLLHNSFELDNRSEH